MEEERLKDIFNDYDPELSSSRNFIERLERNLNAVELIHKENAKATRRNKAAVMIASIAGFLTGFIFSHILPYIEKTLAELINPTHTYMLLSHLENVADFPQVLSWMIIGGVSVFASVGTYNMIISHQPLTSGRREG